MKRIFLILALMVLPAAAVWALPDQASSTEYNGSNVIKATNGTIYMISMNYAGVTAGDKIQIIDGANLASGAGGTVRLSCVAAAANGNCSVPLTVGAYFGTSMYYKETKTGGNFTTDIQYF